MIRQDLPQEASALRDATIKLKEEINKPLWVVRIEDPAIKEKEYLFYALFKCDESPNYLNVAGFSTSLKNKNANLTTYSQALDYFESQEVKVQEKKIPWLKVIEIENKTYKRKTK